MTTTVTSPPVIDYTSRDWPSLRQSMLDYASSALPEWRSSSNADPNDFGVVMIEAFAYMGDILSYYTDRVANEASLDTATQLDAVLAFASLYAYTPQAAQAATVTVTLTVTTDTEAVIPAGFVVSTLSDATNDAVQFETSADVTINEGTNSYDILAVEGRTVPDEIVATSCGDPSESYTLQQAPVVASSLLVRIVEAPDTDGNVWAAVTNLLESGPSDNVYSISLDANEALTITFGDNVNGRIPPRGSVIHALYRVGGGEDGNVPAGSIVDVPSTNTITSGGSPIPGLVVTVTNSDSATGGTDPEDIDSIKTNAPQQLRAQGRAVYPDDFEALALAIPNTPIAKAKCVCTVYTNTVLYIAPVGSTITTQPTAAVLRAVSDYFANRMLAGVSLIVTGPTYVTIDVSIEIVVDSRYAQYAVEAACVAALQSFLSFDNVDFGGRITERSIYTALNDVDGITDVVISNLSVSDDPGISDVVLLENQLAAAGNIVITASGGLVNTDTSSDIVGAQALVEPTAPTGVTLTNYRLDANSSHYELSWTPGTSNTEWLVEISWVNAENEDVQTNIFGFFFAPNAVIDAPLIGAGRATSVAIIVRAYNQSVGPADSTPAVTHSYGE